MQNARKISRIKRDCFPREAWNNFRASMERTSIQETSDCWIKYDAKILQEIFPNEFLDFCQSTINVLVREEATNPESKQDESKSVEFWINIYKRRIRTGKSTSNRPKIWKCSITIGRNVPLYYCPIFLTKLSSTGGKGLNLRYEITRKTCHDIRARTHETSTNTAIYKITGRPYGRCSPYDNTFFSTGENNKEIYLKELSNTYLNWFSGGTIP